LFSYLHDSAEGHGGDFRLSLGCVNRLRPLAQGIKRAEKNELIALLILTRKFHIRFERMVLTQAGEAADVTPAMTTTGKAQAGGEARPKAGDKPAKKSKSAILHLEDEAEFDKILKEPGLVVVDWFATWCGPCRRIAPTYGKIAKANPTARFLKMDVDKLAELSGKWQIEAMPTFVFVKDGRELARIEGADTTQLKAKVAELK
jgi:thioredoxin 1